MKKNWKEITAFVVTFAILGVAIYYTNFIYIPNQKAQQAADTTADNPDSSAGKDYNYTINTSNPVHDTSAADGSGSTDSVQVTQDSNGDVTINRTWGAKPGTLDTSTSSPDETASANIGGGGDKITGEDGTYQGETPTNTTTTTTTTSKPATSSTPKTSSSSNTGTESSGSTNTSSSTPSYGETRVVDGQKEIYTPGFGWVMDTSGGEVEHSAGTYETTGEYVGDMG